MRIVGSSMRKYYSITAGGVALFVAFVMSGCASGGSAGAGQNQQSPGNNGITIGTATVTPGGQEYEAPWPFGPLGADEE